MLTNKSIFILLLIKLLTISIIFGEITNIDIIPKRVDKQKQINGTENDYSELIDLINFNDINSNNNNNNNNINININQFDYTNYTNLVRISDLLDIFSIEQIGAMWNKFGFKLNINCTNDMISYMKGLESGRRWAIEMDDATGHYTTGFLFGNNYWTGSMTLCKSIFKSVADIEEKLIIRKSGLSSLEHHKIEPEILNRENPPFIPGFYVLKMSINEDRIATAPRIIHIGACLPTTCSLDDVTTMATLSQKKMFKRQVNVLAVRSPTLNQFNLWGDTTFQILVSCTTIIGLLMIWGTIYDLIIIRRAKNKLSLKKISKELASSDSSTSSGIGCTTYDLTKNGSEKSDMAVGIGIPSGVNNNNSDENLAMETMSQDENQLSTCSELLLSFSVITNFNAICDRGIGSDTVSSIHGIRAFSMLWIILGHTCIVLFKYSDNMELRKLMEKAVIFQAITGGVYSVDTFFFISGFLVSYIYFRTNAKGQLQSLTKGVNDITAGTMHFFGLLSYRFVRLTTPYIFVLGIVEVTMKYFFHNSVFDPPTMDHVTCPKFWWRNILYINTLFPVEDMCMLWSWYLSDDTQFYIIGAIILIIGVRHLKIATGIMIMFMIASLGTTAFVAFTNNHMPNFDDPLALFDKIYDKPWTRFGPYLVGMTVGWVLFKTQSKIKMNKVTVIIGWILSAVCSLYLVFGVHKAEFSPITAAAFSSLSHSFWALSLAWIVIACSTGYGGYVNSLLSAPCLYPFSRVTYCAYLVHPIAIRILVLNSDAPQHLGIDTVMIIFLGQIVFSYALSFAVSIAFEAPVVTMLKIISPNRKKRV